MRVKRERDFISFFDETTGRYIRTGVLKDGHDTGEDPFMASFPELVDVGVMGHCTHGKSGLCQKAGIQCYQRGPTTGAPNMSLEDFESICAQCAGRTFQFALGGRGDPDQHEHFEELLEVAANYGIVCNFTTSGLGVTDRICEVCAKGCGAVAVSWYRSDYTLRAIEGLVRAGARTNIHYVLMDNTCEEAVERLREGGFPEGVNAVVFLLHKPCGLGLRERMIKADNTWFSELLSLVNAGGLPFKVGFDSCSVPALINGLTDVDVASLDTCEGARWSAYITSDLKMLPCSFAVDSMRWVQDLRQVSMEEAWRSDCFEDFRRRLRRSCPTCARRDLCMGGCPIWPEIVLCDDAARTPS